MQKNPASQVLQDVNLEQAEQMTVGDCVVFAIKAWHKLGEQRPGQTHSAITENMGHMCSKTILLFWS